VDALGQPRTEQQDDAEVVVGPNAPAYALLDALDLADDHRLAIL